MSRTPILHRVQLQALACCLIAAGCGGEAHRPYQAAGGANLYASSGCGLCHGPDGKGGGPMVATGRVKPVDLTDVSAFRYGRTPEAVASVIASGRESERGIMPPQSHLSDDERNALALYVLQLAREPGKEIH